MIHMFLFCLFRPFQFGLVITSWQLPFCMMIIDCLSVCIATIPNCLIVF